MRRLTHAQLEAELQVGTVDMSEVELISDNLRSLRDLVEQAQTLVEGVEVDLDSALLPEEDEFLANLARQADAALATVIPDRRGADSVAVADQELPYIVSESQSEDDEGAEDSIADFTWPAAKATTAPALSNRSARRPL